MLEGIISYIDVIPYTQKRVPYSYMSSALSNLKCFIFLNLCILVKGQEKVQWNFFLCFGITATSFVLNINGAFIQKRLRVKLGPTTWIILETRGLSWVEQKCYRFGQFLGGVTHKEM